MTALATRQTASTPRTAHNEHARREQVVRFVTRLLIAANLLLGFRYLSWRYTSSINWALWPLSLALLAAETYSYVDAWLFGLTMWRRKTRGEPPPVPEKATVDVFITCYNEPVEIVRETVRAAVAIRHPHRTYVLDDGNSPAMREMAKEEGADYIVRSAEWTGRGRHAKAGNLNNAMFQTDGEFLLILDADQIPDPAILDRTLGYFIDPKVAFVQTPQWFYNVPPGDPFGSQAPLFYGPIQQGKDGWNAAFFCGSNAVLRREALMQIGIARYAWELERKVRRALSTADRMLRTARAQVRDDDVAAKAALDELTSAVDEAKRGLRDGKPLQEVTWSFQRRAGLASAGVVAGDMAQIQSDLAEIAELALDESVRAEFGDEALNALTGRASSPLAAIEAVRQLLLAVDVDRDDEAIPVMPMSTVSVTEDMATAMRLHGAGWRSVYHDEILAKGLAPEDLRTALQQRLRWAQGTIQVMLRENPLVAKGLSIGQRLMYFATMWSYLSGFFAAVYLTAPVLYFFFGWVPVMAFSNDFFWHLIPFLVVNQILFLVIGWGRPTWRGQQYSLALFPLWIKAVTSAVGNVYFGRKLGFVVTSKTRQGGASHGMVRWQLIAMVALVLATAYGLLRLALGVTSESVPIVVNALWAGYDLLALSVVLRAVRYKPPEDGTELGNDVTAADARGRAGAGTA